ncbi:hypothetical protein BJ878DRAFT_574744 [Calycina marina]|uniref:Uncharacterized protein n=1 Tax=Calycina marina TaxID=1763456 RepID=A0A9P7Z563_9HELO|nr:hypothetical protein BJ878DRAFT_574744 [Calycina marina]
MRTCFVVITMAIVRRKNAAKLPPSKNVGERPPVISRVSSASIPSRSRSYVENDDEASHSFLSLDIEPAPVRPFTYSRQQDLIEEIRSPETPHSHLHSRQKSGARELLPATKELFQYRSTRSVNYDSPGFVGSRGGSEGNDRRFGSWCDEPRSLQRLRVETVRRVCISAGTGTLPLWFYAFAGAIIGADGKTYRHGEDEWLKQTTWIHRKWRQPRLSRAARGLAIFHLDYDNSGQAVASQFIGCADLDQLLPSALNRTPSLDVVNSDISNDDFTGLQNVTSIYCMPSQIYVDSEINCFGTNCSVTRIRSSKGDHPPSGLTMLGFRSLFLSLSSWLPISTPHNTKTSNRGDVDILQNYIAKPNDNVFIQSAPPPASLGQESRLLQVSLDDFPVHLTTILNSIIQASQGNFTTYIKGGTALPASGNTTSTVSAQSTTSFPIFIVHWPWPSIFLLATKTMLVAAIAPAILHQNTLTPNYLGFVSSLSRESLYAQMPTGGADIDGMKRSKILRDLEVRLGDVGDVQENWQVGVGAALGVGKLGIGTGDRVRALDWRKLYV